MGLLVKMGEYSLKRCLCYFAAGPNGFKIKTEVSNCDKNEAVKFSKKSSIIILADIILVDMDLYFSRYGSLF